MASSTTIKRGFSSRAAATTVAAGILLSRIAGLIRDRVFAHFFGNSDAADAFRAALRIPNFLQNLFGEGVLSASLIPVYARLRAEGHEEEASRVAEAVFALLALTTAVLVAAGMLATPWLIDAIAPGFQGGRRELTIQLVRILFPGVGLLVLCAWCLGILNSHRKFFLSYASPVIWNLAIIAAFYIRGTHVDSYRLAGIVAWGAVAGSALQFAVQLPVALRFLRPLTLRWHVSRHVHTVVQNFFPVFVARGVAQISAYIDQLLASFLPIGAVAALSYAQTIYMLPVSLFGMSVSAAELPGMSSELGSTEEIARALRDRLARGLEQISYFVAPSAVAFLLLGNVVVATIYLSGAFGARDVIYVWGTLAGSAVGLLASTSGRLYASTFYALRDTRTPLKFACIRVVLTLALGYALALPLPPRLGLDRRWGVVGLTISAGIAAWIEFLLLRRSMQKRIGRVRFSSGRLLKLYAAAALGAIAAVLLYEFGLRHVAFFTRPVVRGIWELGSYGLLYLLLTHWLGISTIGSVLRVLQRRK